MPFLLSPLRAGGEKWASEELLKELQHAFLRCLSAAVEHRAPSDFAKKKVDFGFVRHFQVCQDFQEATAESGKVFSTMQTMLTSNSV